MQFDWPEKAPVAPRTLPPTPEGSNTHAAEKAPGATTHARLGCTIDEVVAVLAHEMGHVCYIYIYIYSI